ncbi:hypothetical protein [Cryptosporangium aurantiacum]|uniref:Uncharacterized protein n=1 Tax=Cryptosporangium aurantiacum TaxID=134849 RepID=A0A1M7PDJ1_9ACTN|nr:hypothetical protein [Cryptosporangium aurantiacum]SHN14977.1 hypothetical protein SAMN05443668_103238 [Cryptosporangium aurantiacum]
MTQQPTYLPPERAFTPEVRTRLRARILSETVEPAPRRGRRLAWPLAGASVAAAALVGVFALSASDPDPSRGHPVASQTTAVTYTALALKAAEQNPRLLIDEPGWKVDYLTGFADESGSIRWANGQRHLEINWRAARDYHARRFDDTWMRQQKPEKVTMDGRTGELFSFGDKSWGVMFRPRGASFVDMRVDGMTRAEVTRVLSLVKSVDVETWLAALPPEMVTPDKIDERATEVLAGVPLPPGFDRAELQNVGTNQPYHFGAAVARMVGCGWIAEWKRAKEAGDHAAVTRAADALRGSHDWKFLLDMADEGDYPALFWMVTDQVVAGKLPPGAEEGLNCPTS